MAVNRFAEIDRKLAACSMASSEVEDDLAVLCDVVGPRFAGTPGYRRAANFMKNRFRAYKLDRAELEPFEFTAWRRGRRPAGLTMISPVRRQFECYDLPYSAATGKRGITAEIIDIGGGSAAEIKSAGRRIRGRFVLTDGSAGHRTELYRRCSEKGAAGFILGNRVEGMMLHTGTVANGKGGAGPAVSIACETARQIQRMLRQGMVRMKLITESKLELAETWNVAGELTGVELPEELVIIGGHLDSHDIGPGAYDNACGSVLVIEVARLLASQRKHLKRTVRFIGFAAEEIGLLGSHQYARAHADELKKARFMLNCDTPSLGAPFGLAFHEYPAAESYIATIAKEMKMPLILQNRNHAHSDHYPFILQGVPTAGVGGGGALKNKRFDHMAADTFDKVPVAELRETSAFIASMIMRAANDERWPAKRRTKAAVLRYSARA